MRHIAECPLSMPHPAKEVCCSSNRMFIFFLSFMQRGIFAALLVALLLRIGKTNSLNTDNFTVLVNTLDLLAYK